MAVKAIAYKIIMWSHDFILQSDWYCQIQAPEVNSFSHECHPSWWRSVAVPFVPFQVLFKHSKCSPAAILSLLVGCSVGIMSSYSLLLSVNLTSSHLCCLCASVSQMLNCAVVLIVAIPVFKAAIKSTKIKSHGNKCTGRNFCTHDKCRCTSKLTNKLTDMESIKQS